MFPFKGGNPTLSDDESTVDGDPIDDINVTLNNAINAIIDSDCDMTNVDLQFSNIDGNIEMIQNCVINQCCCDIAVA